MTWGSRDKCVVCVFFFLQRIVGDTLFSVYVIYHQAQVCSIGQSKWLPLVLPFCYPIVICVCPAWNLVTRSTKKLIIKFHFLTRLIIINLACHVHMCCFLVTCPFGRFTGLIRPGANCHLLISLVPFEIFLKEYP